MAFDLQVCVSTIARAVSQYGFRIVVEAVATARQLERWSQLSFRAHKRSSPPIIQNLNIVGEGVVNVHDELCASHVDYY